MPKGEELYDPTKGFVDCKGPFGEYGGYHDSDPRVSGILTELSTQYLAAKESDAFQKEMRRLQRQWLGRPTPMYHARALSKKLGGGQLFLKREDLTHTGSHKSNHCLGEAVLAKVMGRTRIVTDTASGTQGVCIAAASSAVGLPCTVYIGENDWDSHIDPIQKMRLFGATVVKVTTGRKNLKEAADRAFQELLADPANVFYAWSTIAGPQPFPTIVKDLQAVVGDEARQQLVQATGRLPDHVVCSVAGGSNAMGLFQSFLTDDNIQLHAVEPELSSDGNAVNLGNPGAGYIESFSLLHEINYVGVSQAEAAAACVELCRTEGIMPAWESVYALAHAIKLAPQCKPSDIILVNLSGRGDSDEVRLASRHLSLDLSSDS
eukprot:RCo039630